jgi:uncharacterized protein
MHGDFINKLRGAAYNPKWMRPLLFACAICATLHTASVPALAADEDVDRALTAARVRATAGDVVAQYSLGALLYYGANDIAQAIEWIRKAAAQSYAPAEFHIGQLYDFGFGVAPDDIVALGWYRKAADHGNAAAQRVVGDFYRKGRGGLAVDDAEALRWYLRGAEGDDLQAQYQAGQMFFNGTGTARDYVSAYVWFELAAAQTPLVDNQKAILELRNIATVRMTPEQVAEAMRRVAAWKPPTSVPR